MIGVQNTEILKLFMGMEITVKGTENVLKAALEHSIKRVVHVSTISAYGQTGDGDLDELAPKGADK